jgi:hypothetical protein
MNFLASNEARDPHPHLKGSAHNMGGPAMTLAGRQALADLSRRRIPVAGALLAAAISPICEGSTPF